MKNKKLLLVATAAMGVLALGTAGVGTAAWFKTTAGGVAHSNTATGSLSAAERSIAAGNLTFNFTTKVKPGNTGNAAESGSLLLGTAGTGANANKAVYRAYNAGTGQLTADVLISDADVSSGVSSKYYFAAVEVTLDSIQVDGNNVSDFSLYAGVYTVTVNATSRGRLSDSAPTTSATLEDIYTAAAANKTFTITLAADYAGVGNVVGTKYVVLEGDDTEHNGGETSTVSVSGVTGPAA